MTTVFGLRLEGANVGMLVADRQTTHLDERTGLPGGKHLGRKLWESQDGLYCFGHAGNRDSATEEFVNRLVSGEYDLLKVISKGYFPELRNLNMKRMGTTVPDLRQLSSLLLLTRYEGEVKLHTCFPLGSVEERSWVSVGSGDQKIEEYMRALQVISEARDYRADSSEPGVRDMIRVGLEAVRRAQGQDVYSHGLDAMVVSSRKITDHYSVLGDDFEKKLNRIQDSHQRIKR